MNTFKLESADFQIGDEKRAWEIGKRGGGRYIWVACVHCGLKRWVAICHKKPQAELCRTCSTKKTNKARVGKVNPRWKGSYKDKEGYIHIKLQPDNPFYSMTNKNGYVREHRLVMAKYLGRCLTRLEIVDHRDGRKDNNEITNLKLTVGSLHNQKTEFELYLIGYRDAMALKDEETSKQVRLLRWEVKQLKEALQLRLGEKDGSI